MKSKSRSLFCLVLILSIAQISCKQTVTGPTVYVKETVDVTTGLVAHYLLAGTVVDSSGNNYNGVNYGATPIADRIGRENRALSFNGSANYVLCGDILDSVFTKPVAAFTVAGWARTVQFGTRSGGGGLMIGKAGGGDAGPYEWSVTHSDGKLYAAIFCDTLATNYELLSSPMGVGNWFHFAMVFDGTQTEDARLRLYLNGLLVMNGVRTVVGTIGTGLTNSSQNLTIGAGHATRNPLSPNNGYYGALADIRIYNRALTSSQILALYVAY
jgi:hypothetical protein